MWKKAYDAHRMASSNRYRELAKATSKVACEEEAMLTVEGVEGGEDDGVGGGSS